MIKFDPDTHTYTNTDTGEEYISVTTVLGKYKPKFDENFHAERMSKRDGIPKETILETWEKIRTKATDKGTLIHNLLEDYIKTGKRHEKLPWLFDEYDRLIKENTNWVKSTKSEIIVYDHTAKVAGMSDVVIDSGKDYFYIVDFKTNKAFSFENKYNEYFFKPIDHLSTCEFNSYAMQLSMYAYMYSQISGRKLKGMFVLYLRTDKKSFDVIPMNYLKAEVIDLLVDYREKNL